MKLDSGFGCDVPVNIIDVLLLSYLTLLNDDRTRFKSPKPRI